MADQSEFERDLQSIAADLRRLEGEYNMYFAGRLPRPPLETRARVAAQLKKWDRAHVESLALKFRLNTLQSRFTTFSDLWDRALRAREEGRPGPLARSAPGGQPSAARQEETDMADRVVHVTAFSDPAQEVDKLRELFSSLADARRETGEAPVAFHRFAELVRDQVRALRRAGNPEVAFRVSVKDGKVSLTARAMKGAPEEGRRGGDGH